MTFFRGDSLRLGVCTPVGANLEFYSFHPYRLTGKIRFTRVDTLAELDAQDDLDGKKYVFDEATG